MTLETLWFCLIAVLWAGYFVLEGFDFGVGILLPVVGRDEAERDTMLRTIGPVWDGNEVWLVVATGATFAAFPAWYATMFSALYLALLLILVCLILRVVSFEWRERSETPGARLSLAMGEHRGEHRGALPLGRGAREPPAWAAAERRRRLHWTFLDLFSGYTVLAGLAAVLLFALHGAAFLTLRTDGDLQERAATAARRLGIPAAVAVAGFLGWTVGVAVDRNDRGDPRSARPGAPGRHRPRGSASSRCAAVAPAGRSRSPARPPS